MKSRLIFFNVVVFISCLVLTELFFVLNREYGWIPPKQFDAGPVSSKIKRHALPPEMVEELRAKYKNFTPPNSEFRHLFAEGQKISYWKNPFGAGEMIANFELHPDIRKVRHEAWNTTVGKRVYAATYTFENYGRRSVPGRPNPPARKNLLMLGCSQTFGIGVDDRQSMSYFLQKRHPEYNVFNLGVEGAGLSELLDDVLSGRRIRDLQERPGVVIYTMFYDHIERTLCSLDCFRPGRDWIAEKNKYDFDSDGRLRNLGTHTEADPLKTRLYRFLGKSEFLKFIGYGHPRLFGETDLRLYVRLLHALKESYAQWGYDFYLIPINPEQDISDELAKLLDEYKIKYRLYDLTPLAALRMNASILGDGHHNELGHELMAALVSQMLKEKPPEIPAVSEKFISDADKN